MTHNLLRQLSNKLFGTEWPIQVIQTVPAQSPGPWSGSPAIGQEQPFAPSSNNTQTILKLDEWGPPVTWTVTLGATYSDTAWPVAGGSLGLRAEIEIGVGGAIHTFEVDWADGCQLTVVANAIRVNAKYNAINPLAPVKPPSDLRLRVLLARGPKNSGGRSVTFTDEFFNSSGHAPIVGKLRRIPEFATELYLLPTALGGTNSPYAATNHLFLYQTAAPNLLSGNSICDTPLNVLSQVIPMRIPGSARYYSLVTDAIYDGGIAPIFNLGL